MSDQTDKLTNLLTPFGLTSAEASVYLALLTQGTLTALAISRVLHLGRTKVYRLLDKLIALELVVQTFNDSGFKFTASEPSKLELLVAQKEGEVAALHQSLPEVRKILEQQQGSGKPGSIVSYYRGKRGLSQVNWNLLKAKGELLSYEVATADVYMPQREAEKLRREIVRARIKIRTLTNKEHIAPFTEVTQMVKDWWEIRNLTEEELTVKADIFIYNDVYAVCHYLKDNDVFCLEMENTELASMHRQTFNYLWSRAKPMEIIGEHGEVRKSGL